MTQVKPLSDHLPSRTFLSLSVLIIPPNGEIIMKPVESHVQTLDIQDGRHSYLRTLNTTITKSQLKRDVVGNDKHSQKL